MKLGFNDLIKAYNEYKFIQSTYRLKSLPGKTIQESLELLDNWLNK